jgi:hypothetical protein
VSPCSPARPARRRWFAAAFAALLLPPLAAQTGTLHSIDGTDGPPTDEETFYLELINRARAHPPAEGERLRSTTDPDVLSAIAFFRVDTAMLVDEFNAIAAAPPLAFNARLLNAARLHSRDQFTNQFQGHTGTNGSTLGTRLQNAGYPFATAGENVFAAGRSVFHGHAGFQIDWGEGPGGMQTGRGHRVAIHNAALREIGVGVVLGTNGGVGPQVVTQNFATAQGATPLLTGVAYADLSGDDFYSPGEGLGGITVTVGGVNVFARTAPSGAFTVPLPGNGAYTVRFSGLGFDEGGTVSVGGGRNVKLDLKAAFAAPTLDGPPNPPAGAPAIYGFNPARGATRYELETFRRLAAPPVEPAEDGTGVTLDVSAGYAVVQNAIRSAGAAAFNLRVLGGRTQTVTLNRTLLARPGAALTFASRLAAATTSETARVQVSTDTGATWTDVYTQSGNGAPGEAAFSARTANLAALAGRVFQVRLVYAFSSGSFFTSGTAVGWYVDDLRFANCDELAPEAPRDLGATTRFAFTPPAARTEYLLRLAVFNGRHRLGAGTLFTLTSGESDVLVPAGGSYLSNLSVRTTAGTGPQTLIVGFAVRGGAKPLLVRGIGPTLAAFGVSGTLPDPRLDLFPAGTATPAASNDNWEAAEAAAFAAVGAFALPVGSRDAAVVATLAEGAYTAQVTPADGSTGPGIALVELYDAAGGSAVRLVNVSARSQVGTGADVLVAGFTVAGNGPRRLLLRAIGPTLASFGVTNVLQDPRLDLYPADSAAPMAGNDNWEAAQAAVFSQVGAFALPEGSRDAVLVATLEPGSYTAQISGVGGTTGVALVEVYELP